MVDFGRNFDSGIDYDRTMENAISEIENKYGESNGEPQHTLPNEYGEELGMAADYMDRMDEQEW